MKEIEYLLSLSKTGLKEIFILHYKDISHNCDVTMPESEGFVIRYENQI